MCVTVPCKVLQVAEGQAEVNYEGRLRWVHVQNMPDLTVGEYVTIYAGTVLDRMPTAEAEAVLLLFAELAAMEEAFDD